MDAVWAPFGGQASGGHKQATLAYAVSAYAMLGDETTIGKDVDDLPLFPLDHLPPYGQGKEEVPFEVYVHRRVPFFFSGLLNRTFE